MFRIHFKHAVRYILYSDGSAGYNATKSTNEGQVNKLEMNVSWVNLNVLIRTLK